MLPTVTWGILPTHMAVITDPGWPESSAFRMVGGFLFINTVNQFIFVSDLFL